MLTCTRGDGAHPPQPAVDVPRLLLRQVRLELLVDPAEGEALPHQVRPSPRALGSSGDQQDRSAEHCSTAAELDNKDVQTKSEAGLWSGASRILLVFTLSGQTGLGAGRVAGPGWAVLW